MSAAVCPRGGMKTIGLIGGMSWESTALYYRIVNREVGRRLGGLRSAKLHLASLDFEEVVAAQKAGAWDVLATHLAGVARTLERAGADCVLIGTNTMHRVAEAVQSAVSIPLLHIVDVTAAAIHAAGCRNVALLGTRYTMEQPFYVERLARHGIACVIPGTDERAEVHRVIFDELCKGQVNAGSRRRLQAIVRRLRTWGAEGVILGCTELSLALAAHDVDMPLFDTTELHALAAVAFALGGERADPSLRPDKAHVPDGLRLLEPSQLLTD
jgi:aspartate racemase